jgi:hypothetical protein
MPEHLQLRRPRPQEWAVARMARPARVSYGWWCTRPPPPWVRACVRARARAGRIYICQPPLGRWRTSCWSGVADAGSSCRSCASSS